MKDIRKLLFTALCIVCSLSSYAKQPEQPGRKLQTQYLTLNPAIMQIYHELDSIFPLRYLANESPTDCAYWVNYTFASPKEKKLYRPWIESLIQRLKTVESYSVTEHRKDSADVYAHGIQGNATTPATEQKDAYYLHLTDRGVAFYYNARIKGRDFKYQPGVNDPNSLPRQDIADEMEALLNRYAKRKGTKKEAVSYDPVKTRYNFVTFNSNVNRGCSGYRYIVPDCKESDYAKFRDAIKRHSMTSSVRTSSNDVYWQYEECAICVFKPGSTNPVMIGAALKGTDLYLILAEGDDCCFLPRAWAEDSPVWDNRNKLHSTGRKALAPPAVK